MQYQFLNKTVHYIEHTSLKLEKYSYIIILIILLIANFLLRVDSFRHPFYYDFQDWSRYYLTAHHIVRYGEFPLLPLESGISFVPIMGNPFYFYFLAAQLLFKDDILFIGWINLFLQIFNLVLVFLLAKYMFGRSTALIALVIFGFSENILNQSYAAWPPYSLQPFLTLSYLLLLFAYLRKNHFYLLFSIAIFLMSWGIHYSAFGIIPAYSFLAFIIFKKIANSKMYYAGVFITVLLTLLLVYFPRFFSVNTPFKISLLKDTIINIGATTGTVSNSIEILNSLYLRLEALLKFFLVIEPPIYFYSFSLFIVVTMIFYFLRMRNRPYQKPYFFVLFWAVVQFIFLAAFVKSNYPNDPFPSYYLTPALGIFAILVAEASNKFLPNRGFLNLFKILFIILFLYASSPNLSSNLKSIIYKLSHEPIRSFFYIPYQIHPAIEAVKSEIITIKTQERINDFSFFQLRGYRVINDRIYDTSLIADVTLFFTHLEIGLNTKLTKTIDSYEPNYRQLGSARYIFLICPSRTQYDNPDECFNAFLNEYSTYKLTRNIFNGKDYKVYLMKKLKDL